MIIEDRSAAVNPPPLSSYPLVLNSMGDLASVLLPKLAEFDILWELANRVCDRYLKTIAV